MRLRALTQRKGVIMNIKLFMLSALGFIGLQAADQSGMEFTIRTQSSPPIYRPTATTNAYPSAPLVPMAPDLTQCTEDQLYQALVAKQQAKDAVELQTYLAAERHKRGIPESMFRTQGSLPISIPQAGRYESTPTTPLQSVQRSSQEQSSAFDALDPKEQAFTATISQEKRHQRQRSLSDTDALTKPGQQSPEISSSDSLSKWRQTLEQSASSPTKTNTPATEDEFDTTVLSKNSCTAFKDLVEAANQVKHDLSALVAIRYKLLLGAEEKDDASESVQKATRKDQKKQQQNIRQDTANLCKIHKSIDPLLITKK